jgi:nicotinamide-nucleotide amidase
MSFAPGLVRQAGELLAAARTEGIKIVTAESCTGGLIAGLLTEVAGASDVFERGFVTYSNQAKEEMLGVPAALLRQHGAVSEPVARAMAEGAIRNSTAHLSVAVTGIAGPGGGSEEKPVGLVHIAAARAGSATAIQVCRFGDIGRDKVRLKSVEAALTLMATQL